MYRQKGFTLIELMIAVAIIGILAAIAIPNYLEYLLNSKRAEGMALLQEISTSQERAYAQTGRYVTNSSDIGLLIADSNRLINNSIRSENDYYRVTVATVAGDGGYTLTATQDIGDVDCGNLTLNAIGIKGRTGSDKPVDQCWR